MLKLSPLNSLPVPVYLELGVRDPREETKLNLYVAAREILSICEKKMYLELMGLVGINWWKLYPPLPPFPWLGVRESTPEKNQNFYIAVRDFYHISVDI